MCGRQFARPHPSRRLLSHEATLSLRGRLVTPVLAEENMPLRIMPHGRLQEWVAEEKGLFAAEGLEYTFVTDSGDYGIHAVQRDDAGEVKTGAFETFGAGRDGADVSC